MPGPPIRVEALVCDLCQRQVGRPAVFRSRATGYRRERSG
jgi:hypothetical protein